MDYGSPTSYMALPKGIPVLAASGEGPGIFLLSPDAGAQPGMRVK